MINEEKILSSCLGKDNHFKVPEGYFDHLMEQVMGQLPEQEAQVIDIQRHTSAIRWHTPAIRRIAAAVAVVALLGGGIFMTVRHQPTHTSSMAQTGEVQVKQVGSEDAAFEEMANYTMMDNETIYASLIAEN